ncbi:MAG: hypothetical protein IPK60_14510 [Sandaracinaceae bacterium]|nr:hypothetical protein [Sandaracinaceae bacterium]
MVLTLFALTGCEELSPQVLVKDTRLIGGEIRVEGDPGRASPQPGEVANVLFYVASPPGVNDELNWAFYSCLQSVTAGGLPRCEGTPSLADVVSGSGTPTFSFTTPTPSAPPTDVGSDAKPTVLILGVVCMNGAPTFDAMTMQPSCGSNATRTFPLIMRVPIQTDESSTNHNPSFGDVLRIGESPWPANDAIGVAAAGCASLPESAELPRISRAEGNRKINFEMLDRANAELVFTDAMSGATMFEALQVNMATSAGNVDGISFEVLESNEIPDTFDIDWVPPDTVVAEGELVKFWFVMRDGRSGSALTERAFCLVP